VQRHAVQARHRALELRETPQPAPQGRCILQPPDRDIQPFAAVVVALPITECFPRLALEHGERRVRDAADGLQSGSMLAERRPVGRQGRERNRRVERMPRNGRIRPRARSGTILGFAHAIEQLDQE
jgi:hypothetical protein